MMSHCPSLEEQVLQALPAGPLRAGPEPPSYALRSSHSSPALQPCPAPVTEHRLPFAHPLQPSCHISNTAPPPPPPSPWPLCLRGVPSPVRWHSGTHPSVLNTERTAGVPHRGKWKAVRAPQMGKGAPHTGHSLWTGSAGCQRQTGKKWELRRRGFVPSAVRASGVPLTDGFPDGWNGSAAAG